MKLKRQSNHILNNSNMKKGVKYGTIGMRIEIFKSARNKQWYFHVLSHNGNIVAQSEGYKTKQGVKKTARSLCTRIKPTTPIIDLGMQKK